MKKLLELHYLQNFAPSNLNRDDTGAPKDAIFGGYRRGRISSQSYKKAMRDYFNRQLELIPEEAKAIRTKRVVQRLEAILEKKSVHAEQAKQMIEAALGGLGLSIDKESAKSQYLVFLGETEIQRLADIICTHKEAFAGSPGGEAGAARKTKDEKKDARKAVSADIKKELEAALDGGKAIDLALFGRMLADLPGKNRDAACQVAHAISTHTVEREFDFYTAVDDLKPDDNAGADMLGTIEFNSACMYRYMAVDLEKLKENLQGDMDIFYRGLEAFVRASALAIPTGKQNSFAAFNPPALYLAAVRKDANQRNLANAFEKPVNKREFRDKENNEFSLTEASLKRLEEHWSKLEKIFGSDGSVIHLNATNVDSKIGKNSESFDKWIAETIKNVKALMES